MTLTFDESSSTTHTYDKSSSPSPKITRPAPLQIPDDFDLDIGRSHPHTNKTNPQPQPQTQPQPQPQAPNRSVKQQKRETAAQKKAAAHKKAEVSAIKDCKKKQKRSDHYTAAILRGQNPLSIASASQIFDHLAPSNSRVKHVKSGKFLYDVVSTEIEANQKHKKLIRKHSDGLIAHSKRSHSLAKIIALRQAQVPVKVDTFKAPYERSTLPSRLKTPMTTLRRSPSKFYVHKTQQVEQRVVRLARKLGVQQTNHEKAVMDLAPNCFEGYVKDASSALWTSQNFTNYFNDDEQVAMLYGMEYGLQTIGDSWLSVKDDRYGTVKSGPVEKQFTGDKVTYRMINFDDQMSYSPLVYGKYAWIVVVTGYGESSWRSGSLLSGRVSKKLNVPIVEQHGSNVANAEVPMALNTQLEKMINQQQSPKSAFQWHQRRLQAELASESQSNNASTRRNNESFSTINNVVGRPECVKIATPGNKDEFRWMVEKPSMAIAKLNDSHNALGRWIIRPATSTKKNGDLVANGDEVYLEQDFFYLSSGHVSEESDAVLRQLPHDFKDASDVMTEDGYKVDRRGVFKIQICDVNPTMTGVSCSDVSVERLEHKAKDSLRSSMKTREGEKEYCVIDNQTGMTKPLKGGASFPLQLRLHTKGQSEVLDSSSLQQKLDRERNPHEFFKQHFDEIGPPLDDVVAKISGAASLASKDTAIIKNLSYGRVDQSLRCVERGPRESNLKHREGHDTNIDSVMDDGETWMTRERSLSGNSGYSGYSGNSGDMSASTGGLTQGMRDYYAQEDEDNDDNEYELDMLCDSVTLGSHFKRLRWEEVKLMRDMRIEVEKNKSLFGEVGEEGGGEEKGKVVADSHNPKMNAKMEEAREEVEKEASADFAKEAVSAAEGRLSETPSANIVVTTTTINNVVKGEDAVGQTLSRRGSRYSRESRQMIDYFEVGGKRRSLCLPRTPAKNSKQNKTQSLQSLETTLLKEYTKNNMMENLVTLDGQICKRLVNFAKMTKFNEMADFEKMTKDNLEVERKMRGLGKQGVGLTGLQKSLQKANPGMGGGGGDEGSDSDGDWNFVPPDLSEEELNIFQSPVPKGKVLTEIEEKEKRDKFKARKASIRLLCAI